MFWWNEHFSHTIASARTNTVFALVWVLLVVARFWIAGAGKVVSAFRTRLWDDPTCAYAARLGKLDSMVRFFVGVGFMFGSAIPKWIERSFQFGRNLAMPRVETGFAGKCVHFVANWFPRLIPIALCLSPSEIIHMVFLFLTFDWTCKALSVNLIFPTPDPRTSPLLPSFGTFSQYL